MFLKWLLWQHLVQYLSGKIIFIASMSKRKVVGAGRSLTYDLSSTKGFGHGRDRVNIIKGASHKFAVFF